MSQRFRPRSGCSFEALGAPAGDAGSVREREGMRPGDVSGTGRLTSSGSGVRKQRVLQLRRGRSGNGLGGSVSGRTGRVTPGKADTEHPALKSMGVCQDVRLAVAADAPAQQRRSDRHPSQGREPEAADVEASTITSSGHGHVGESSRPPGRADRRNPRPAGIDQGPIAPGRAVPVRPAAVLAKWTCPRAPRLAEHCTGRPARGATRRTTSSYRTRAAAATTESERPLRDGRCPLDPRRPCAVRGEM